MNKDKNKIKLSVLQERLQARMNYDEPRSAFKALLVGFEKAKKYPGWVRNVRRRGLSMRVAHEFAEYVGYPIDKS